jgi:hypothetical protein
VTTYDVYGTSSLTAPQLRDRVGALLDVAFREHDSSYLGVYYRAGDPGGEHLVILANVHDDPDELPRTEFAGVPVLLEVNATERPEALRALLGAVAGLELLHSTTR